MKASMAYEEISEEPDLSGPGNTSGSTDTSISTNTATPVETAPTLPPVLSGRAQMEQERIARQKAREGQTGSSQPTASTTSKSITKPAPSTSSKIATMADISRNAEAGPSSNTARGTNGSRPLTRPTVPNYHPLQSTGPFPTDDAGEYYLDGEMRHNALTIGRTSTAPTFSAEQIVGKVSCQSRNGFTGLTSRKAKSPYSSCVASSSMISG